MTKRYEITLDKLREHQTLPSTKLTAYCLNAFSAVKDLIPASTVLFYIQRASHYSLIFGSENLELVIIKT